LPDLEKKTVKDTSDYFCAGGTAESLRKLVADAAEYVPKNEIAPTAWFKQKFPGLAEKYGEPACQSIDGKRVRVAIC